jgi:hypothetical protein
METLAEKGRAVKYDKFGGIDLLHVDEVPVPHLRETRSW